MPDTSKAAPHPKFPCSGVWNLTVDDDNVKVRQLITDHRIVAVDAPPQYSLKAETVICPDGHFLKFTRCGAQEQDSANQWILRLAPGVIAHKVKSGYEITTGDLSIVGVKESDGIYSFLLSPNPPEPPLGGTIPEDKLKELPEAET